MSSSKSESQREQERIERAEDVLETRGPHFQQHAESSSQSSEHVSNQLGWPTLAESATQGAKNVEYGDDVRPDLSEEFGPRTRHRKPKPKPGVPFKVLKARAAAAGEQDDDQDGDPLAQIAILPPELLARIFAHLNAQSILQCAAVCKAFASVVRDESTWRLAFAVAFGIEAIDEDERKSSNKTPVLRRLNASSWKLEYAKRTEIIRRWRRARAPTVLSDARIEFIDTIALSLPHNFMLCASAAIGVASRSDPFTGKVAKGYLDVSGMVQGVSLTTLGLTSGVSCVCLEADATRIVWGFHNGAVGITTLARQGTNPRGAVRGVQFSQRASHVGPVKAIAMPFGTSAGGAHSVERSPERLRQRQAIIGDAAETFVTGGMDGSVRLWSPKKVLPIWTGIARQNKEASGVAARPAPVLRLAFHVESGTIVAATVDGHLTMWTKIDIASLLELSAAAFEEPTTFEPTPTLLASRQALREIQDAIVRRELPNVSAPGEGGSLTPTQLHLDVMQNAPTSGYGKFFDKVHLLIYCQSAASFERQSIDLIDIERPVLQSVLPCPDEKDRIISLRPDFETLPPVLRSTSMTGFVSTTGSTTPAVHLPGQPLFSERKFVCAGTQQGKLLVWDWEQEADSTGLLCATLCLNGHHTSITAIDVTEHAIVIGTSDGTIKAFCPLSGQLIRTFNDRTATRHPARMLAAGQLTAQQSSRYYVSHIIAGEETIVASIGSQVLAWRAEKLRSKPSTARKTTSRTGRNAVGRLWDPKKQSMKEMERDVYETRQELQVEHEQRVADSQRLGRGVDADVEGLTEQEAFEYAMMLSRDEMEANGAASTSETRGLEDALEQIARAESSADSILMGQPRREAEEESIDEDGDHDHDDEEEEGDEDDDDEDVFLRYTHQSSRASQASSPMSSPYVRGLSSPPSRAWDILQNAGSSASRNTRVGDAFSKVQSIHVPRSARSSSRHQSGAATASSSFSSRRPSDSMQSGIPALQSPHDWPSFEPSTSLSGKSPSRFELDSPVPTPSRQTSFRPSFDNGAGSPSPSSSLQARSPIGVWAKGSPSLRPVNSERDSHHVGSPSALAASRPSQPKHSHSDANVINGQRPAQSASSSAKISTANAMPSTNSTCGSSSSGGGGGGNANDDILDDDMRFAIELSLAEERSRLDSKQ